MPPSASDQLASPGAGPSTATAFYIDAQAGSNANPGTAPELPWQDFTNINGGTLCAGQRLLIRRGSVINQELMPEPRSRSSD